MRCRAKTVGFVSALVVIAAGVAAPATAGTTPSLASGPRWIAHGPLGGQVEGIAIGPQPDVVVAVASGRVWWSDDSGSRWHRTVPSVFAEGVAADPSTPGVFYVTSSNSGR